MYDSVRILILSLLQVALDLSRVEGLQHVRFWLEIIIKLSDVLDIVVNSLGPLLLKCSCWRSHLWQMQKILQLSTMHRVGMWNKALDLFRLQLLQIIFRLIKYGGIKLLFVVSYR